MVAGKFNDQTFLGMATTVVDAAGALRKSEGEGTWMLCGYWGEAKGN